jgi:hypothetical protein
MLNHSNSNGLEKGRIPAHKECPFWDECGRRDSNCPSQANQNLRTHPFSCGLARGWSMVKLAKNRPRLLVAGEDGTTGNATGRVKSS